jgi:hypothetical protein
MQDSLTVYYRSAQGLRARNVSPVVHTAVLDVPPPTPRLIADWQRECSEHMNLEPGDVEEMPLARSRSRWPNYRQCVQAISDWTELLGMPQALAASEIALMACRGARYHHDAALYAGMAFCNLFLSEDKGLDLLFATTGQRIPLRRGTAVIFDTAQPHAVLPRGKQRFIASDFTPNIDYTQVFLTWELPLDNSVVANALQIAFGDTADLALATDDAQVMCNARAMQLKPETGRWS